MCFVMPALSRPNNCVYTSGNLTVNQQLICVIKLNLFDETIFFLKKNMGGDWMVISNIG